MRPQTFSRAREERGAILIQVAVAMVGLLAFAALVTDYGILWASRRQAQNAADAAALAAAISLEHNPGNYDLARAAAKGVGELNKVFGRSPTINQGAGDTVAATDDISFPLCPPGPGAGEKACVRVNVYRDEEAHDSIAADPLPTFFGRLFGMTAQGVKATATAQIGSGNSAKCLLPFAIIDRWADNYDENIDTAFFKNDGASGTAGWSENDMYQPTQGDVYIGPYAGNPPTTGWTIAADYGRQLILKEGSTGVYSSGWAQQVDLPFSGGSNDYRWNIENCNTQSVGIADKDATCTAVDWAKGCISVKTGIAQGPTDQGISSDKPNVSKGDAGSVISQDPSAAWSWAATGPDGQMGAVVGGQGMASPRIRPIVIIDIGNYISQGCSGTGCIGKVANIIGFFTEGMCGDVDKAKGLDAGFACDDPKKDVVGRIVTLPASYATGVGTVQDPSSFLEIVRLVR